ncbi:sugar phosphate isomerase/epimerase family protein [Cohnella boryungensis]|uniref:Sugar phosphate isomerase/epimerase family protein n=1 Tax=Cohnella boryungensis TaxID=768479 RepID=A0ABV8SCK3_9BACL
MKLSLCTISFRHELVSFDELMRLAQTSGFSGIELWSVHAASLSRRLPFGGAGIAGDMRSRGLELPMISGYVKLLGDSDQFAATEREWEEMIARARLFGTDKLRIFAGDIASASAGEREWATVTRRLRQLAEAASRQGVRTVVETHPGSLADCTASTLRVLEETEHPWLGINLDFLHLWEAGDRPKEAYEALKPWTVHYHCKNIGDRRFLNVFEPGNVYAPGGSREGMVPLAEGAVDYAEIIRMLAEEQKEAAVSLEWFGADPVGYLSAEKDWIDSVLRSTSAGRADF